MSWQIQLLKTITKEQVELIQTTEVDRTVANIKPGPGAFKEVFKFVGCRRSKGFEKPQVGGNIYHEYIGKVEHFRRHFSSFYGLSAPDRPNIGEISSTVYLNNCPRIRGDFNEHTFNAFNALHNTDDIKCTNVTEVNVCIRNLNP